MTERRPATLHDVAARVGVSPRTVSRVVRNERGFSEETRARVMEAVEALDYRPNANARGLISGRSNTIALVATYLTDPFFPEFAEGVQRAAQENDLTLLFGMTQGDLAIQHDVLASLESHSPQGVIIFVTGGSDAVTPFLDRGVRMIPVDADFEVDHPNARAVRSDLAGGARASVDHLLDRGCRQLAMLAAPFPEVRREAFVDALPAAMERVVVETDITVDGGRDALARLLAERPDVDGVFTFNDVMAIGALQAAAEAGRRVPDDIAVIGVDDVQISSMITPALTTVRIDAERVGAAAVRLLLELVDGDAGSDDVVLPVELVRRASA